MRTTNRADPVMARLSGTYVRRSGLSQRQIVVPLISATRPWAKTARRSAVRDQRDSGTPPRVGSSHASALTATTTLGGKAGWARAARLLGEPR